MSFKWNKKAKSMGFKKPVGAKAVKKIVRSIIAKDSEKKFLLQDTTPTVASWDGQVVLLSGVAQGDTTLTREGRQLTLRSMSMKYQWDILNPSDALAAVPTVARPKFVRCIIFRDKLGDGTVPTAGNVLQTPGTASACLQHLEYTQIDRWAILHDKVYTISPGTLSQAAGSSFGLNPFDYQDSDINVRYNKVYKKFKGLKLTFQGDDAAQGSVLRNAIYCLFLSDQNVAATSTDDARARIAWNCRFRFTDD